MKSVAITLVLGAFLTSSFSFAKEEMRNCSSKSATSLWKNTNPTQASTGGKPQGQRTQTLSGKVSGVR
jgi:hypothetical protein